MMSKGKRIVEILTNENPNTILYDDMEDSLIGVYRDTAIGQTGRYIKDAIAVYSYIKFIEIYIKRDGMSEEEAIEFFDFNIANEYLGKCQPIIIDDTGV